MFRDNLPGGNAAHTVSLLHSTLDEQLCKHLREHLRQLRLIIPVISVSVLALRRQNAELDEEIALVLDQHARDPLDLEVEELEAMLESLALRRTKGVVP